MELASSVTVAVQRLAVAKSGLGGGGVRSTSLLPSGQNALIDRDGLNHLTGVTELATGAYTKQFHTPKRLFSILIILPCIGVLGFMWIEDYRFLDALYMSFITLSTVGYEVVKPLSDPGKVFVVSYLAVGLSVFFYCLTRIGEMAVDGQLHRFLGGRLMDRQIRKLRNHLIICGAGRMGSAIAQQLYSAGEDFVIIDKSEERLEAAKQLGWTWLHGDGTSDEVLKSAGVEHARCLASVMSNDADNLYAVLSARMLSKELTIIARASDDSVMTKFRHAGADKVVSPHATGAVKISQLMINPHVQEFIELFADQNIGIELTVVQLDEKSPYVGRRLHELALTRKGVMIIGIKRPGAVDSLLLPPPHDEILRNEDSLIAVGKAESMARVFGTLDFHHGPSKNS